MSCPATSKIWDIKESGRVLPEERFPPRCSCKICQSQFLSLRIQSTIQHYSWKLTDAHAQNMVNGLISRINKQYNFLVDCVRSNGDEILRLWQTGPAEREAYLTAAGVKLPPDYNYPISAWYDMTGPKDLEQLRDMKMWLAPHLNLRSLKSQASNFLSFLHNRTEYPPMDWIASTNEQLNWAWDIRMFNKLYVSNTCMFVGPDHFGELKQWDAEAVHQRDALGFSRAVLSLSAILYNLRFAGSVAKQICRNINPASPKGSEEWTKSSAKGFDIAADAPLWSNQPSSFSVDPKLSLDLDFLERTAQARQEAFEDHLRLLQTDAEYMLETRRESVNADIRLETSIVKHHQEFGPCHNMMRAFDSYHTWGSAKNACQEAKTHSGPSRELSIACLEVLLSNCRKECGRQLQSALDYHPRFCKTRLSKIQAKIRELKLKRNYSTRDPRVDRKAYREDELDWGLRMIASTAIDNEQYATPSMGIDRQVILGILTEYLNDNPDVSIDDGIVMIISDITSLDLMIRNVRAQKTLLTLSEEDIERLTTGSADRDRSLRYKAEATTGFLFHAEDSRSEQNKDRSTQLMRTLGSSMDIIKAGDDPNNPRAKAALNKFWHKFYSVKLEDFRSMGFSAAYIEQQLSLFLDSFNAHEQHVGPANGLRKIPNPVRLANPTTLVLQKNQSWKTKGGRGKPRGGKKRQSSRPLESSVEESESLENEPEVEGEAVRADNGMTKTEPPASDVSIKPNTDRPNPNAVVLELDQIPEPNQEDDIGIETGNHHLEPLLPIQNTVSSPPPRYLVPKRTLEFMEMMFSPGQKGSTTWKEFVSAMCGTGCSVTAGGGGYTFEIRSKKDEEGNVGGKRSILIHRIHWRDPKINFTYLRIMGARLQRRWGWDLDMFGDQKMYKPERRD